MDINKILSIGGRPGLWEMKAQTRGGVLAESLTDGKKIPVNVKSNISILGEISIYTYSEEIPLKKVFQKIGDKENFQKSINPKASKDELVSYFREVLPEFDEDRVYQSDIKKIIQWYNTLIEKGVRVFVEDEANETSEATEEQVEEKEDTTKK
jgi:predicted peroxiredoxin